CTRPDRLFHRAAPGPARTRSAPCRRRRAPRSGRRGAPGPRRAPRAASAPPALDLRWRRTRRRVPSWRSSRDALRFGLEHSWPAVDVPRGGTRIGNVDPSGVTGTEVADVDVDEQVVRIVAAAHVAQLAAHGEEIAIGNALDEEVERAPLAVQ